MFCFHLDLTHECCPLNSLFARLFGFPWGLLSRFLFVSFFFSFCFLFVYNPRLPFPASSNIYPNICFSPIVFPPLYDDSLPIFCHVKAEERHFFASPVRGHISHLGADGKGIEPLDTERADPSMPTIAEIEATLMPLHSGGVEEFKSHTCSMCASNSSGQAFARQIAEFIHSFDLNSTFSSLIGNVQLSKIVKKIESFTGVCCGPIFSLYLFFSAFVSHALLALYAFLLLLLFLFPCRCPLTTPPPPPLFTDTMHRSVFSSFEFLSALQAQQLCDLAIEHILFPKLYSSLFLLFR